MLSTIDGKRINRVPHTEDFEAIQKRVGPDQVAEARADLNRIIDEMTPDAHTGLRSFSSSFLGSKLTPWAYPVAHLYDDARTLLGASALERDVQSRAALSFGLFIWECIMNRDEEWVFYDPNLSTSDPNREITGKVYFERGN